MMVFVCLFKAIVIVSDGNRSEEHTTGLSYKSVLLHFVNFLSELTNTKLVPRASLFFPSTEDSSGARSEILGTK